MNNKDGKIGLITIHDTVNFGSLLQTFSLYKALESMDLDIELIDYKCKAIAERETTYAPREWKSWKDVIRYILFHRDYKKKYNLYKNFLNSEMELSPIYNQENIRESNSRYSTYIVGSDIVWGLSITGHDFTYMLDFADESKRKLAFSASVGTKWDSNDSEEIRKLLSKFERISVREDLASQWITPLIGKDVPVTCDPTMLWGQNFWKKYVRKPKLNSKQYVLVYMSDECGHALKDASEYARKKNLEVYNLNFGRSKMGVKNIKAWTVQEWMSLINDAAVVFTGSYHGLLFSLYMHTPVFYYNRAYTARMLSLCRELGIEYREGTAENIIADRPLNFNLLETIIQEKRFYSWSVLRSYFS